jgi:deoxycytidylate deaminase
MDNRRSKENYYLDIADAVLRRSTCLRRMYGAIIVRNDEILSTGYNGAPRAGATAPTSASAPGAAAHPLRRTL